MESEGRAAGPPDFGTLLRSFRLTAGLSQEALAERAGMSAHGIRALERGYRRTPQRGTLALLAGALALSDEQCQELEVAAARWVLLRDGGRASVTFGPWVDGVTSSLPLSLASFIGRERELEEIATLVHEHRLVTLTGSGGVGKTQMALHVATGLNNTANHAASFIALAPVRDPSFLTAAIASTLGVQEVPNRPLLGTLLAYLRNKSRLLILDNCEHVIEEAATVADTLLAGCPQLRILATSREPLRAAGERTYRLPSLSTPSCEAAARLRATDATAYGAVVVFRDRARAVDHRFSLTDENAPAVAELCRRLDGIPLAIELAAARMNALSITALVERLEDHFRILAGGERTALPRQQTMRATIDWSYNLLSAPEQRVFERLSVFAGGCTLASAEAVCAGDVVATADVVNLIASLVDKSMVIADFDVIEPRYRPLESFRQYAHEKLASRGEEQVVAHRHAHAYFQLAERLERMDQSESEGVWRVIASEELGNWRTALRWALADRGDIVLGQRLLGEFSVVWRSFASIEARRWLGSARELVDERTPTSVLAGLSLSEAMNATDFSEPKTMLSNAESAIASYRAVGDLLGAARAQSIAGYALTALGRGAEVKPLLEEVLAVARRLEDRRLILFTLRCLGYASARAGDLIAARGYLGEVLVICEAIGNKLMVAMVEDDLAEVEYQTGNGELAVHHSTNALAILRTLNDTRIVRLILTNNASLFLVSSARYDEAQERAREALAVARERGHDAFAMYALQHLGYVAALRPQVGAEGTPKAYARAARILGFADAHIAAMGFAREILGKQEYDRVLAVLRDAMGAELVANLMSEGAAMTEDQAVAEASEI
ncbi:MAG: helix-turn-helix domain-containing protein [Candidatus Cybelea sp.]